MKHLGILCSGGDGPGMNCAIRSLTRSAIDRGIKVMGIQRGYQGLIQNSFIPMNASSVGNIIQRGGTILQTSRCPEFFEPTARSLAAQNLKNAGIDALAIIGGDGSFKGAWELHKEHHISMVGLPGTIDNDIAGTDYTIGFNSAVETAMKAVDQIRDTAHSHARNFLVEVMGRRSPYIAIHVGLCTGAENIILDKVDDQKIVEDIQRGLQRGKSSSIIIVAEGESPGRSYAIQDTLLTKHQMKAHVCILGHIQRGGAPSALDRFIASRMGHEAVESLMEQKGPKVIGMVDNKIVRLPWKDCLSKKKVIESDLLKIMASLSI